VDGLHDVSLDAILHEHARSHPQRTATVCGRDRATWPELNDRVARLAGALHTEGVDRGGRVLWLGQNCHRVLELLLACGRIGAMFCPANWRQSPAELAFVIDDIAPRVIVWQAEEIGDAVTAARGLSSRGDSAHWIQHDGGAYEVFLASAPAWPEEPPSDPRTPVLLLYTAAFGGAPNAAMLTHAGIIAQNLVVLGLQQVTSEDVYLNSGPLFHIGTFWNTLATFHAGGTNVFVRRVEPEEICRIIEAERCTDAYLLPPTRAQIAEVNRDGRWDLSSLQSRPPSPWSRAPGGYGQTEVVGMATYKAIGGPAIGVHGRPHPLAQVRIVDDAGVELPPGEVGEIVVRGPTVMAGYYNRPELTAARQRGGWHHTNDLGRREDDGSITFIGPKTTMIKSAAENIYPAEVEGCIQQHPSVREVAIIGVPDERWTQSVKAIVALHDGATATADDIIEHCRANIASYKKPRTVEFVDALPRLPSGAVDRDALDARFGGGGYPGGTNRSA
jgi:acyl-CoA synthetase (AMP-forming)/AMP-acid ligase II